MHEHRGRRFTLAAISLVAVSVAAQPTGDSGKSPSDLPVGHFYIGGTRVHTADAPGVGGSRIAGTFVADKIGVLHLAPSRPDVAAIPVVLSPGFGLPGHLYLETVDGRRGWAYAFLDQGWRVFIVDRAHTARTGFDVTAFNDVREGRAAASTQPLLMHWLEEQIWTRWGFGPGHGEAFADGQFPVKAIEQLTASFTAVPVSEAPLREQARGNVPALIAMLERVGPAVLVTHSASGLDGFAVATRHPELVRALVAVEPVGCDADDADALRAVPVLSVFGDHLEVREQMRPRMRQCQALAARISAAGGIGAVLDLPALGVRGNSHIMMSDRNSDEIVARIIDWLRALVYGHRP